MAVASIAPRTSTTLCHAQYSGGWCRCTYRVDANMRRFCTQMPCFRVAWNVSTDFEANLKPAALFFSLIIIFLFSKKIFVLVGWTALFLYDGTYHHQAIDDDHFLSFLASSKYDGLIPSLLLKIMSLCIPFIAIQILESMVLKETRNFQW